MFRLSMLITFLFSCWPACADEAINKAYFERGIEIAKIVQEECKVRIASAKSQLKAVRSGIKEEGGKPYFLHGDEGVTYHYVTKEQKSADEKRELEKVKHYRDELRKSFQVPCINVFDLEAPIGAVGVLRNISHVDSFSDPIEPYKVKIDNVADEGFLAQTNFKNGKTAWFQGFDKSKIAIDAIYPISEFVLIVGPTDTPYGRYLTIRKIDRARAV